MPQLVMPLEEGAGQILGGNLEYSNVDVVEEFVNIIKGQRGYQANARMVTTSDSILEETINLKR
jgi:flagellar hook protein FlgE